MTLAFLNIGAAEMTILIFLVPLCIVTGNYGRNTALGYWGSVLLCFLASPLVALIVISILRFRSRRAA